MLDGCRERANHSHDVMTVIRIDSLHPNPGSPLTDTRSPVPLNLPMVLSKGDLRRDKVLAKWCGLPFIIYKVCVCVCVIEAT